MATTIRNSTSISSPFERLPTELVRHIFFFAFEPNLALVNRSLFSLFGNEETLRLLILFAFFQPDGTSPVETKHFLPATYRHLTTTDREDLQRRIWDFTWCNTTRLDACMPALSRLAMVQAWHREANDPQWLKNPPYYPAFGIEDLFTHRFSRALQAHYPDDLRALPDIHDEAMMQRHFFAQVKMIYDRPLTDAQLAREPYKPEIMVWRVSAEHTPEDPDRPPFLKLIGGQAPVLAVRHIPHKFLRGSPWTDAKFKLFSALIHARGVATLDMKFVGLDAETEQMVFRGMGSAIEEQRPEVLKALLEYTDYLGGDAQARRPQRKLPRELFAVALARGRKATVYLHLLLRAGINIRGDGEQEKEPTKWAQKARKQQRNPLGVWLLKTLRGRDGQDVVYMDDDQSEVERSLVRNGEGMKGMQGYEETGATEGDQRTKDHYSGAPEAEESRVHEIFWPFAEEHLHQTTAVV